MMHKPVPERHHRAQPGRLGTLMAALVLAACSRKAPDSGAPGSVPPSGLPPLAAGSAHPVGPTETVPSPSGLPAGHPDLPAGHPDLPPGHPGVAGSPPSSGGGEGELPAGHPTIGGGDQGAPVDPKQVIAGTIQVAQRVKDHIKSGDVVYLVVRQQQKGAPGAILAVDRLVVQDGPLAFRLDAGKAMVPGAAFRGKVVVTARVDKDGDAMTKNPGDVEGKTETEIPNPSVIVTLDTVLQ
jgi:hypothetical protein